MLTILAIYLVLINIAAFAAYGMDKRKAKRNEWRTPESVLLLLAAVGGSVGAYAGMQFFRHKTKHLKFTIGVPAIFIVQVVLAVIIWRACA